MERVQNTLQNQSYDDPSTHVCSAESAPNASELPPEAQSPESVKATPGTAALLDAYAGSGTGGAAATAQTVGAGGASGVPEEASEEPVSCERELRANALLCGMAGSLIAARLGLGPVSGSATGTALGAACSTLSEWIEYNTPLGDCGDD